MYDLDLQDTPTFSQESKGSTNDEVAKISKKKPKRHREDEVKADPLMNIRTESYSLPPITPPMKLTIEGIPRKSRVETQIKMNLKLTFTNGQPVTKYKSIFLAEEQIAPNIRKKKGKQSESEIEKAVQEPHLFLRCKVVGSQNPDNEIFRCINCIQRERKNYRKKIKNLTSNMEHEKVEQEFAEIITNKNLLASEKMRVIQFHTGKYVDIVNGEAKLPLRITCYCRHHKEPYGFSIQLALSDGHTQQLILSTATSHILITDDHKSNQKAKKRRKMDEIESYSESLTLSPKSDVSTENNTEFSNDKSGFVSIAEKVIPKSGPISGGIEVTVLGKNFLPHQHCYFGQQKALTTEFWNSETIVCVLPPSAIEGPVSVYLSHLSYDTLPIIESAVFVYKDESDKNILEIALQLVGVSLTGQIQDPKKVAMDIVQSNQPYMNSHYNGQPTTNNTYKKSAEDLAISALQSATNGSINHDVNLSIKSRTGHTLLHYAIIKGYTRLFGFLLDFIYNRRPDVYIDLNAYDNGGFTPLHFASIYSRHEMASELIYLGACPDFNNEIGDIPLDFAIDDLMREIMLQEHTDYTYSASYSSSIEDEEVSEVADKPSDEYVLELNDDMYHKQTFSEDEDSDDIRGLKFNLYKLWMWFYHALSIVWSNYRVPIYIGLLVIMGGLLMVEYIPFKLSRGIESPVGSILTDGSGNPPDSSGNNSGGIKIFNFFANLPWWQIYFSARWLMVCGLLFGLASYFKFKMRKPISWAIQAIICVLFFIGLLYIFGAFG